MQLFTITSSDGIEAKVNSLPDSCPICRRTGSIEINRSGVALFPLEGAAARSILHVVCRCPNRHCSASFITKYTNEVNRGFGSFFVFTAYFPFTFKQFAAEDGIAVLSPQFVAIAQEAAAAEEFGLTNIAGLGHRKALEFLIKDYCGKRPSDR